MSLVCAVPKRGVVYFAADMQSSCAGYGYKIDSDRMYKLQVIGNKVVGYVGSVTTIELGLSILNELKDRKLTKNLLLKEYLPRFLKRARELELIKDNSAKDFKNSFPNMLIAEGGTLYEVSNNLIIRLVTPEAIGSGGTYILNSLLEDMRPSDVNDRLTEAIIKYGSNNIYVNSSVQLIDTKSLKMEVRDDSSI